MGTPANNSQGELRLPPPVMPFPQGATDSRTGCCGLTMNQFFPAGEPLFARMGIGELNTTLHIGPVAKLFAADSGGANTHAFATSGRSTNAQGKNDGGLYYGNSPDQAGHLFSGFRTTMIGQTYTMTMKDGPRCKEQYDCCVKATEGVPAYVKRVR